MFIVDLFLFTVMFIQTRQPTLKLIGCSKDSAMLCILKHFVMIAIVLGTSIVRLHATRARRTGVPTGRRHHSNRPHGSALVARRDRHQERLVPCYIRHTLPLLDSQVKKFITVSFYNLSNISIIMYTTCSLHFSFMSES